MMRLGPSLLLLLLAACATEAPAPPLSAVEVTTRATPLGQQLRAAQLCEVDLPVAAQDRAARIEAAAIALHQREGGLPARDSFLRGLAPPRFEPRQRGRDRAAWCRQQREALPGTAAWLDSAAAETFAQRAEALLR